MLEAEAAVQPEIWAEWLAGKNLGGISSYSAVVGVEVDRRTSATLLDLVGKGPTKLLKVQKTTEGP